MTKLYVNGCSFTHGHDYDNHNWYTQTYGDFEYNHMMQHHIVWPHQLAPEFSMVFNHAKQGSGAMRMVRTTLRFLKSVPDDELADWIFVLQFSQANRFEIVSGDQYDFYSQVHLIREGTPLGEYDPYSLELTLEDTLASATGHSFEALLDSNADLKQEFISVDQNNRINLMLSEYVNYVRNDKQCLYAQTKELYLIVTELERRGVKYLITAMDPLSMPHQASSEYLCDATQNLMDLIPDHNIIASMEDIIPAPHADYHDPCGHPNEIGHQMVARYILDEMKKRGYI